MSATSATLRGRRFAEAQMVDACTVKRLVSSTVNPDTGQIGATSYTTIYTGKCKVQQLAPATVPTAVGQAAEFVGQLMLHLPVSAVTSANVAPDDLVTITAAALDASLVSRTFRLRGPAHKTYATARRLPMVEVAG